MNLSVYKRHYQIEGFLSIKSTDAATGENKKRREVDDSIPFVGLHSPNTTC
jgi:hypothetical protein